MDLAAGLAVLEEYSTSGIIATTDTGSILKLMHKAGRNHYSMENSEMLVAATKNTIGIPDPHGVYAFRMRTNSRRLMNEIS